MLHLHRAQYRSMPWRNGMGVTLEIAREPDSGDHFQWRLSLATLAGSGPFSSYAGYQRSVTLIEGAGFRLGIGGQDPVILQRPGATAMFAGAEPAHCTLINGPCTDLSLMVREPGAIVSVIRIQAAAIPAVPLEAGALKVVFCLGDGAVLGLADDSTVGSPARAQLKLALHDTVLLGEQIATLSLAPAPGTSADLLLLTWKPPRLVAGK
jgi:environmental stress-induced protein Ves